MSIKSELFYCFFAVIVAVQIEHRISPTGQSHTDMRIAALSYLYFKKGNKISFNRYRFRKITRLINVAVASLRDIIAEQLHRHNLKRCGQQLEG